jgi:type VI secretion system protein
LHESSRPNGANFDGLDCFVLLVCALAGLSACGGRHLTVKINIVPSANANNPIAVDLVQVPDKDLAKEIGKLTAADWFQKKEQYFLDYPRPDQLKVVDSREWIPGQSVSPITITAPGALPIALPIKIPVVAPKSPAMFVFANYFSPGPHRANILPNKITTIQLGLDDLKVVVEQK